MKISSCIDMMFSHRTFDERIAAVQAAGIDTVEFWKWTNKDIEKIHSELESRNMKLSVFNIDSKDEKLSYDLSRGILNAGRKEEFLAAIKESTPVYKKLGACGMIVLVGEKIEGMSDEEQFENIFDCLLYVRDYVEQEGITLVVEPLNDIDRKNYFMPYSAPLMEILQKVNSPRIKMLYDIYHQHMMGDFSMKFVAENLTFIGHFHVADCPGRHEPGTGEVDYVKIISDILKLGYCGYVGLEYRATCRDEETFGFLKEIENA
ncbi:MAG: TIM barrel protein [Clostridia bacterium]|nr:TIM barrel protein [Clostridia bacterium]